MGERKKLRSLLPKKLSASDVENFLNACAEEAQEVIITAKKNATGDIVKELRRLAKQAKDLRRSLAMLSEEGSSVFSSHFAYLSYGTSPPIRISEISREIDRAPRNLDGGMLSGAWDILTDLEAGANYAADMCTPQKRPTVGEINAKALVRGLVRKHFYCFGVLPPRNKGTWFPEFAQKLGDIYGLKCGLKVVRGEVLFMKALPEFQKQK